LPLNLLEPGQIQRIGKRKPTHRRPVFLMGTPTQVFGTEGCAFVSITPVKFSIAFKKGEPRTTRLSVIKSIDYRLALIKSLQAIRA